MFSEAEKASDPIITVYCLDKSDRETCKYRVFLLDGMDYGEVVRAVRKTNGFAEQGLTNFVYTVHRCADNSIFVISEIRDHSPDKVVDADEMSDALDAMQLSGDFEQFFHVDTEGKLFVEDAWYAELVYKDLYASV